MGYTYCIYLINKSDFSNIDGNFIRKVKDVIETPLIDDIISASGGKEVTHFKYPQEGEFLCSAPHIPLDNERSYKEFIDFCEDEGFKINVLGENALTFLIISYRDRVLKELSEAYASEDKDVMKDYIFNTITWLRSLSYIDPYSKDSLSRVFLLEHEIFNLIHLIKMYNWSETLLVIERT